jgi:hypothetical protein
MSNLTLEEKKLKKFLESNIRSLESSINDYNDAIRQLPVTQYNHFEDMRRDVDIRRETLLQELCELSEGFHIEPVVERLHRQSAQMIGEIDACDKEFRDKFKEIRIRPIEYDAHDEKRRLDDEFKKISKKTIANVKYENELRIEELRQRRLHLSLIENALKKKIIFFRMRITTRLICQNDLHLWARLVYRRIICPTRLASKRQM